MPVRFPERPDVHLNNAPLQQVICQVRFPPILRIATEEPTGFQELIRGTFPKLGIEQQVLIGPFGPLVRTTPPGMEVAPRIFRFQDQTENRSVTLAPDFFALVFDSYNNWRTFSETLSFVFEAIQKIYRIPYATRIGLRYINVLTLENTKTRSFDELLSILRDELVMLLRIPEVETPYLLTQQVRTKVDDGDFAFRFGLREGTSDKFELDFDRYIEGEVEVDNLIERCERYHRLIYNAFRWCIAEGKLDVFEPVE
jgi:uncharacterized protein (TIGR04255 family)